MEDVKWLEVTLDTTEAELDALCARLWRYGSLKEPSWLVQSLCGGPFDPRHFTDYLTRKYTALYKL